VSLGGEDTNGKYYSLWKRRWKKCFSKVIPRDKIGLVREKTGGPEITYKGGYLGGLSGIKEKGSGSSEQKSRTGKGGRGGGD